MKVRRPGFRSVNGPQQFHIRFKMACVNFQCFYQILHTNRKTNQIMYTSMTALYRCPASLWRASHSLVRNKCILARVSTSCNSFPPKSYFLHIADCANSTTGSRKQSHASFGISAGGMAAYETHQKHREARLGFVYTGTFENDREHIHHDEIDSTQSEAKRLISDRKYDASKLTIISAGFQTAGQGTGSRQWVSRSNKNVLVSYIVQFPQGCDDAFVAKNIAQMTQLACVGAVDAITQTFLSWGIPAAAVEPGGDLYPQIKWPNDVIVNGQKVCGVIANAQSGPSGRVDTVILGIGINVLQDLKSLAKDCGKRGHWPAGSLAGIVWNSDGQLFRCFLKEKYSSDSIPDLPSEELAFTYSFLHRSIYSLLNFYFREGFRSIHGKLNAHACFIDQMVRLVPSSAIQERAGEPGRAMQFIGFDDDGAMLLTSEQGAVEKHYSGELLPCLNNDTGITNSNI
jgi:biotin-(acetyl-CoA carboxylase) ligase